jgi:hypothetical protein
MAKFVIKDYSLSINGVDLSGWTLSATINYSAETPESTCMGDTSKRRLPGLLDWDLDGELRQDYGAGGPDVSLFSLVGAAAVPVIMKPTSGAISATNPAFTGNALLSNYLPIGGKVGEVATTKIKMMGDDVLDRDITP